MPLRRDGGRSSTSTTRSRSPVGHSVQQFGRPAFGIGELRAERVERDIEGRIVGHRAFGESDQDGGGHLVRADRRRRPHGDDGHRARLDVVSAGKPVGARVGPIHRPDPSKSRASARNSPAMPPVGARLWAIFGNHRSGRPRPRCPTWRLRQFGTSRPHIGACDAHGFGLIADRTGRPLSVRALCRAAAVWCMRSAAGLVSGPRRPGKPCACRGPVGTYGLGNSTGLPWAPGWRGAGPARSPRSKGPCSEQQPWRSSAGAPERSAPATPGLNPVARARVARRSVPGRRRRTTSRRSAAPRRSDRDG